MPICLEHSVGGASGEFWYGGRKWRLWNIETIDEKYYKWRMYQRSCSELIFDL
jgi:hypothetical protein